MKKQINLIGRIINKKNLKNIIFLDVLSNLQVLQICLLKSNHKYFELKKINEDLKIGNVIEIIGSNYTTSKNIKTIEIKDYWVILKVKDANICKQEFNSSKNIEIKYFLKFFDFISKLKSNLIEYNFFETFWTNVDLDNQQNLLSYLESKTNIESTYEIIKTMFYGFSKLYNIININGRYILTIYEISNKPNFVILKDFIKIIFKIFKVSINKKLLTRNAETLLSRALKTNLVYNYDFLIKWVKTFLLLPENKLSNLKEEELLDLVFNCKIKKYLQGLNLIVNFKSVNNNFVIRCKETYKNSRFFIYDEEIGASLKWCFSEKMITDRNENEFNKYNKMIKIGTPHINQLLIDISKIFNNFWESWE